MWVVVYSALLVQGVIITNWRIFNLNSKETRILLNRNSKAVVNEKEEWKFSLILNNHTLLNTHKTQRLSWKRSKEEPKKRRTGEEEPLEDESTFRTFFQLWFFRWTVSFLVLLPFSFLLPLGPQYNVYSFVHKKAWSERQKELLKRQERSRRKELQKDNKETIFFLVEKEEKPEKDQKRDAHFSRIPSLAWHSKPCTRSKQTTETISILLQNTQTVVLSSLPFVKMQVK
jgi:hypothetical protein